MPCAPPWYGMFLGHIFCKYGGGGGQNSFQKKPSWFPSAHNVGAAISGPRIAGGKSTDIRLLLISVLVTSLQFPPHPGGAPSLSGVWIGGLRSSHLPEHESVLRDRRKLARKSLKIRKKSHLHQT